ncbi:MAG TPA: EamA family transporter [Porphyromonadaceae bacterium]|jgi:drug/metabolite transporter (DMT)-like permease|nr:DMT family transporter [Petrimonas sp.]HBC38977.1 EamA family transporter [Porphyromonadaceae bacterium]HBQ55667.1 EamA family transporter [Porphyromonadaceae bacterium]HBU44993.1 EamA family transporter [Porphyromonadaceae bacterium]HCB89588.1 EamA family transporter [Porphyromonadaceae bacterium]
MAKLNKQQGHLALFTSSLVFGLNIPIARTITPGIVDPFLMTFLRMFGAAVLFWIASLFIQREFVPRKDILLFFSSAVFAIVINQASFIVGLSKTSPIDASLVVTLSPVITMLLAAIFIKEPITLVKALGVLIGASGALVLILSSTHNGSGGSLAGNLLVLLSVTSYALYLTLFKNLISRYSSITSMKWMFLFATVLTYPMSHRAIVETDFTTFDTSVYLRIGYVVALATFFTYMLIPIGQKTLRPTTISMYNYLQPIAASFLAVAIGMDRFGWDKIISTVLVFTGVYLVTQSKSRIETTTGVEDQLFG